MRIAVLSCLALLACGSLVVADDYVLNTSDGYYYYGGVPYTRSTEAYTTQVAYRYGCCTYYQPSTAYRYVYARYYAPTPALSYKDPDWRARLLAIASQRDVFEGKLRASANEHNQFLESVGALGMTGNFHFDQYGLAPSLANPYRANAGYQVASAQLGNYGASGNSIVGYSYANLVDAYGTTDANLLYQQAAALAKNSQDLGGQATTQFSSLVEQAGNNRTRVAEVLAKGLSARTVLDGTNAQASVSVQTYQQGTGVAPVPVVPPANGGLPGAPVANALTLTAGQQGAAQYCVQCHSGTTLSGGYNVLEHWNMDRGMQRKVLSRLLLPDGHPKLMPKRADGQPGKRLPAEIIQEFMTR